MTSNFDFLSGYWSALAKIGATAESYLYNDPNACIYKIGMFAERLIQEIFVFEHLPEPTYDNTHSNRIKILKQEGLIDRGSKIDDILYALRKNRNDAVHNYSDSVDDAKTMLRMAHHLAVWFMQVYGDWMSYTRKGKTTISRDIAKIPPFILIVWTAENCLRNIGHNKFLVNILFNTNTLHNYILPNCFLTNASNVFMSSSNFIY